MAELLRPGAAGAVVPARDPTRRTSGTLVALRHRGVWVSIDTHLPNSLVGRALGDPSFRRRHGLPDLPWRPEVTVGHSRFDFAAGEPRSREPVALLEVKSANLRVGTEARFPDAPTVRGTRHLRELAAHARGGRWAGVLFVVQRGDVEAVGPNRAMDPAFAAAFDAARSAGVRFSAVRLRVDDRGARLGPAIPVRPRAS